MPTTAVPSLGVGPVFSPGFTKQALAAGVGGVGALGLVTGNGPTSWAATDTAERSYQFGARYEGTEGTPTAPSLALVYYGFWRFRWVVGVGSRSLTVYTKQADQTARPTLVLKANSAVGLVADVTTTAAGGTGWTAMTASFTCTAVGMVWVELHNNYVGTGSAESGTCYFDRISVI